MPATDRPSFREALGRGPILLDAGMGTRLIDRGLDLSREDPALWVVDHPEVILEIHRLDIAAGSDALLTCTFGANRVWLDRFDRAGEARNINHRAVELARLAAGPDRLLIGSIGPTATNQPEALFEQAEGLIESGVDALILETHSLDQALAALRVLRASSAPLVASLFEWPDPINESARRLIDAGALAIGANCQLGLKPSLELAKKLAQVCDRPLLLKPAGCLPGLPSELPEAFEAAVAEWLALGVRLLGGCCGTTEAHIAGLRAGLDAAQPSR